MYGLITNPSKNRNTGVAFRPFSHLFEDFFNSDFGANLPSPKVNISEGPAEFTIELAVPGLEKDAFHVTVNDNVLTISGQKVENKVEGEPANGENGSNDASAETNGTNGKRYLRREFHASSFERAFTLPQSVDVEGIGATYESGVLHVHVPKREEAKAKSRTVEIR